jgi:PAS domain S-box-containing protein
MGELFAATDWSATPLGAVASWPQSLRIAVSICLNSRFPMFVWWGPSLINIYNDAYIPILGQRHPTAFGRPARDWWEDIWDVLGPQVDTVMKQGHATWNERVLLMMERNGFPEETYFTWSYSPIHDDDGTIGGLFCACTEETARVAAEAERDRLMREAQDAAGTLHTWFDNAPGFIALLRGPNFVFEMVNRAYYQLVGHRPIEGLPAFEALPDVRNQGFEEILSRVYEEGEPFVARALRLMVQRDQSGPATERFLDLVYQPVRDASGAVVGIFAQGHDVTEQVQAVQALKDADRRKDEFLATLAHELRNPLAPIRQAASLAKSPRLAPERRTWAVEVIERQAGHMALLLDDLLDVSRISTGKLELRRQWVDLQTVVAAAVETARPLIDAKTHGLTIRVEEQPQRIFADPVRLAQVLSNLLSNAAKYTDAGGRVELTAGLSGGAAVISVRDNGIGLSAASTNLIFEMFSQVASALDRAEGGLGIGLALSRGLVALHGGRIEVKSDGLGTGSEFIVHLPLAQAEVRQQAGAPAVAPQARVRTVLIADDNEDARDSMAQLVELQGHRVYVAADGTQALALAQELSPDVAVLDIGMPAMNGYEVARNIRAAPWGRAMQLIALTGWGQADDQAQAHAAGFDHHLTKPADPDRLFQLLAQE